MNSVQKFLGKFLCVVIIFSGVVGDSERAWGASLDFNSVVSDFCAGNPYCHNQILSLLSKQPALNNLVQSYAKIGNLSGIMDVLVSLFDTLSIASTSTAVASVGSNSGPLPPIVSKSERITTQIKDVN